MEDALKKNRELWLVLQDMHKAYDSVNWYHLKASLHHIKMYNQFIDFFGKIHEDYINRVITDFGLSDGYIVHDGLDQNKIKRHNVISNSLRSIDDDNNLKVFYLKAFQSSSLYNEQRFNGNSLLVVS
ncbi:hypothetical protein G9A89_006985 [Geosiphon pyriformis]|nr:hypothetical protein G9A89_006985 [Geosiphon pyriformis]